MQVQMTLDAPEWARFLDGLKDKSRLQRGLKSVARVVMFKEVIDHFKNQQGPLKKWRKRSPDTDGRYWEIKFGRTMRASWEGQGDNRKYKPAGSKFAVPKVTRDGKRIATTRSQWDPFNKLLQMTGYLRKGFSQSNIRERTGEVVLFNAAEYSRAHDEGSPAQHLPQRQFMWLSRDGMDLAGKMLMSFWTGEQT